MLTIHIDLDECVTNNIERCHQDAECTKIEDFYTCVCTLSILVTSFRSEEHTSELQSHVRISYAVFCLKKKKKKNNIKYTKH